MHNFILNPMMIAMDPIFIPGHTAYTSLSDCFYVRIDIPEAFLNANEAAVDGEGIVVGKTSCRICCSNAELFDEVAIIPYDEPDGQAIVEVAAQLCNKSCNQPFGGADIEVVYTAENRHSIRCDVTANLYHFSFDQCKVKLKSTNATFAFSKNCGGWKFLSSLNNL